mmetsp:Transcript_12054/g.16844  ORF Transcript_12054/g.16844 Transcript_12054/m.16844 type:complete len:271 (-) Transcript_12054:198-1010(-)|eukprot:CAMPEP_0184477948 /NCGR_PEP_ID=MMETSP0113_2-20130426/85_1 /TAXON_ID=91329 /ORGANISM="Norrisiella sphaerica, Strain BC52" /LENGTH=270 /DNA_ID=CAMNT_0026855567 /DNA_START=30 /DNA_END=842 /DNA_ORIENTATION=+
MKTALAFSCVLNVALATMLCALVLSGRSGHVSSGIVSRSRVTSPVTRIAPMQQVRDVAAYAVNNNKQVVPVSPRPADLPANKVRIRFGAPAAAAATIGVCNIANVFPALAAGKIFDFDMTFPYMASEIILLSFFLDKLWFGPMGQIINERNQILKDNLESASGNLDECDDIIAFAESSLMELRSTINSERDEKLAALTAECDAAMSATKDKVNKEIDAALEGIEKDRQVVLSSMAQEIEGFCWEIMGKVLSDNEMKDLKALDNKLFKVAA